MQLMKSDKLKDVCYDIRGPVLAAARRLEEEGFRVAKLNIGDPAPWGFEAPEEIVHDVIVNLSHGQGYSESQGLFSARKAVMQHYQALGVARVQIDDIFLGNGVSELITMAMHGLLNDGDEVLIPAPDYPLWTAAVNLAGGRAVHYLCDEESDWAPDTADMASKINTRTRAIVVINPNNPTGAVYPRECLEQIVALAREHRLVLFADEIYDKIIYDGVTHTPLATLADDLLIATFNGLSKTYRVPGYRSGWMLLSGAKHAARDYIEGLGILAAMRLSSNVPGQLAIQTSLGGFQSINQLTAPRGRLTVQRDAFYEALTAIPGITCTRPQGAFYLFPKLDAERFGVVDDERLILDLLMAEKVLLVHGTAFGWHRPDHFRVVFLPRVDEIAAVAQKLDHFFRGYVQEPATAAAAAVPRRSA
jgi:alanine-synthesizing transaminase